MFHDKLKSLDSSSPSEERQLLQKQKFESLCMWIEAHLNEPLGWQELMSQTGWDYQTIQTLFYRYKCTTAMTWIRLRRQAQVAANDSRPLPLSLRSGPH